MVQMIFVARCAEKGIVEESPAWCAREVAAREGARDAAAAARKMGSVAIGNMALIQVFFFFCK